LDNGLCRAKKLSEVLRFLKKGNVLECGTGTGKVIATLQRTKDFKVIGLDISINILKAAKNIGDQNELVCADAQHLPFRENSFDNIICLRTFRMLSQPLLFLKECKRVLKKRESARARRVVFSFETTSYPLFNLGLRLKLVPKKEFDHYYSLEEGLTLVKSAGLQVYAVKRLFMLHPPLLWTN